MAGASAGATTSRSSTMPAAQHLNARDLRAGDVIHFGGARAHVTAIRHDGALVVVGVEELGAFLTFDGAHPVVLLARPAVLDAERSATRRERARENRLDGARNHYGFQAAAA